MDLAGYTLRELLALRRQIDDEVRARHANDPETTEYHLRDLADEWGTAVASLLAGYASETWFSPRQDGPRYQHPFDPRLNWDGTGAKPPWVRQWESSGNSLAELEQRRRE